MGALSLRRDRFLSGLGLAWIAPTCAVNCTYYLAEIWGTGPPLSTIIPFILRGIAILAPCVCGLRISGDVRHGAPGERSRSIWLLGLISLERLAESEGHAVIWACTIFLPSCASSSSISSISDILYTRITSGRYTSRAQAGIDRGDSQHASAPLSKRSDEGAVNDRVVRIASTVRCLGRTTAHVTTWKDAMTEMISMGAETRGAVADDVSVSGEHPRRSKGTRIKSAFHSNYISNGVKEFTNNKKH